MKKRAILILILAVSGCENVTVTTRVISEPSGVAIELNDEYLGKTPLDLQWLVNDEESRCLDDNYELVAIASGPNQYSQRKIFWARFSTGCVKAPKTIYFNMYLAPVPERFDIDIQ